MAEVKSNVVGRENLVGGGGRRPVNGWMREEGFRVFVTILSVILT
jgi:hypothetical protein